MDSSWTFIIDMTSRAVNIVQYVPIVRDIIHVFGHEVIYNWANLSVFWHNAIIYLKHLLFMDCIAFIKAKIWQAFVLREISISWSSITHLVSAPLIFQGGPMATWAYENSKLAMGKFPNDSYKIFIMAEHWPQPQSKTLALQWLLQENFGSRHVHSFHDAHWTKRLEAKLAVGIIN